jgi:hypothetical protein
MIDEDKIKEASSAVWRADSQHRATVVLLNQDDQEIGKLKLKERHIERSRWQTKFATINKVLRWMGWRDYERKLLPCDPKTDAKEDQYIAMHARLSKMLLKHHAEVASIVESHCGWHPSLAPERQADAMLHGLIYAERMATWVKDEA